MLKIDPDAHGKPSFNWLERKSKDEVVDSSQGDTLLLNLHPFLKRAFL